MLMGESTHGKRLIQNQQRHLDHLAVKIVRTARNQRLLYVLLICVALRDLQYHRSRLSDQKTLLNQ
jgi:hypothetical protein